MHTYRQQLTAAVAALDLALRPSAQQHELKRVLLRILKPLLQHHVGGSLQTFGSCANGFWVKGSDIDSCIVAPGITHKAEQLAKLRVVKFLVERYSIGSAEVIPAQVPIAKVVGPDGLGLLDVSISNSAALENSALVRTLGSLDPRIPQLGRAVKHWATLRGINNRADGTLSTYTLMLQLFFFLQTRSPPILPTYKSIELYDARCNGMPAAAAEAAAGDSAAAAGDSGAIHRFPSKTAGGGEVFVGDRQRPLPFISDCERIKREVLPGLGRNEESVGDLLQGFFYFYGAALPRLSAEAPITIDVYDASLRVGLEEVDPKPLHRDTRGDKEETASCSSSSKAQGCWLHTAEESRWRLPPSAALKQPRVSKITQGSSCSTSCTDTPGTPPVLMVRCPLTRSIVNRFSRSAWAAIAAEFARAETLLRQQQPLQCLYTQAPLSHRQRSRTEMFRFRRLAVALARSQGLLAPPMAVGSPGPLPAAAAAATAATPSNRRPPRERAFAPAPSFVACHRNQQRQQTLAL